VRSERINCDEKNATNNKKLAVENKQLSNAISANDLSFSHTSTVSG